MKADRTYSSYSESHGTFGCLQFRFALSLAEVLGPWNPIRRSVNFTSCGMSVFDQKPYGLIMAALWNRVCRPLYFALWFLSFFLLSFFPRLISAIADWMSTILLHMAWP